LLPEDLMRRFILISALLLLLAHISDNAMATEQYAIETGQACTTCHISPSGGGELTTIGEGFALSLMSSPPDQHAMPSQAKKTASFYLQLVTGYLHILFAIFWFGTILYVHLILKPAYASGGLPRGEVRLGLFSMLIMAITGAVLTAYRVPSFEFLVTTRFGILLCLKVGLFLIMVGSALFVVLFIGPRLKRKATAPAQTPTGDLTMETLSGFDGKENRSAYVGYRGKVYDVTDSRLWKHGNHLGRHAAGFDLTEALSQAPHGEDKVFGMPEVGPLLSDSERQRTPQQKVFYAMAYMNLGFVLLIILILALWKWW
jgi:predicted heme/steroid binding protein/uncharacterized membrane protein